MLLTEKELLVETRIDNTERGREVFLEGVFLQSEKKNRNNRIYPKTVLERAVDQYIQEYVKPRKAIGELNHPDYEEPKLEEAAILIESLEWQGNDVIGKAKVLNTPKGNILRGLLEGGYQAGVSSRGTGSVVMREGVHYVQNDLRFTAIDFVDKPSAFGANPSTLIEAELKRQELLNEFLNMIKSYK